MIIKSPEQLGKMIKKARTAQGLKQVDLALASGTGERFIVDLEKGKSTCELGKALHVASMLGLKLEVSGPGLTDE